MKKIFILPLAVCLLAASARAQEKFVQVPYTCGAEQPFTISIPIRLPTGIDTVFYHWYCSGQLIEGSEGIATSSNRFIRYTIPANSDYSGDVAFRFAYKIDDDEDCDFQLSPGRYVISFGSICPPTPGAVSFSAYSCNGVSTPGVISLAAYSCSGGLSTAGAISFAAHSCNGGISTAGAISFAPASK